MNTIWIVEVDFRDGKGWQPTVGAALNREDGRARLKDWKSRNNTDRFRLARYSHSKRGGGDEGTMTRPIDPDFLALKRCVLALEKATPRMVRPTIEFLIDRFLIHPPRRVQAPESVASTKEKA